MPPVVTLAVCICSSVFVFFCFFSAHCGGQGATPKGDIPFLALYSMKTQETIRLFESPHSQERLERVAVILSSGGAGDGSALKTDVSTLDTLRVLIASESPTEPTNYYIHDLPIARPKDDTPLNHEEKVWITRNPNPYPSLAAYKKDLIKYPREDGVELSAVLYTPGEPDGAAKRTTPYPAVFWAYPREFKDKEAASQIRESPFRFTRIGWSSPILWLACG